MIKQSLAVILSLTLSGCANLKYNNGITDIDQGRIEEKGIIQSKENSFILPLPSSPKVETDDSGEGVYFTVKNGVLQRTYLVSGKLKDITKLYNDLGRSNKITIEFYPNGEYLPLANQTNRFFYNHSIPRKDCAFTFELNK